MNFQLAVTCLQGVALTGRNSTGPPSRQSYRRWQTASLVWPYV